MTKSLSIRAFLEMDDGAFCSIEHLLKSPEHQKHCVEKRELKKILRLLEKNNLNPSNLRVEKVLDI